MVVGLLTLELFFPEADSLKGKRSLARPLLERLRRDWNVSATEVDHLDQWQRATFAVASVNTEPSAARRTLDLIVRHVEQQHSVQLIDHAIEIL